MSEQTSLPRVLTGVVISDKMEKTIVVLVKRQVRHPKYKKFIRRSTKVHVHDADNLASKGDTVVVKECRPLSKQKSWMLERIQEKAEIIAGDVQ